MIGLTVFMYVFFAILAIGTIAVCLNLSYKRKEENRLLTQEKEILKSQYDQSRKEKIDIEEKANNALAQERTFKVAYEDWKSKYENLESKYIQTRKEMDQHLANQQISIKSIENEKASKPQEVEQKVVIVPQVNVEEKLSSKMNDNNVESSFVLQELKQILNQHVQIISGIIADEKSAQKTSQAPIPSDPLTLIDGINEEKLNKDGKINIMVKSGLFEEDYDILPQYTNLSKGVSNVVTKDQYHFVVEVRKILANL